MITDGNRPPHGKGSDDKHISRGMAREQMANKPKQEGAHVDHRPIWAFPPTPHSVRSINRLIAILPSRLTNKPMSSAHTEPQSNAGPGRASSCRWGMTLCGWWPASPCQPRPCRPLTLPGQAVGDSASFPSPHGFSSPVPSLSAGKLWMGARQQKTHMEMIRASRVPATQ